MLFLSVISDKILIHLFCNFSYVSLGFILFMKIEIYIKCPHGIIILRNRKKCKFLMGEIYSSYNQNKKYILKENVQISKGEIYSSYNQNHWNIFLKYDVQISKSATLLKSLKTSLPSACCKKSTTVNTSYKLILYIFYILYIKQKSPNKLLN